MFPYKCLHLCSTVYLSCFQSMTKTTDLDVQSWDPQDFSVTPSNNLLASPKAKETISLSKYCFKSFKSSTLSV